MPKKQPVKKKSRTWDIISALAGLGVVAGLGFYLYYLISQPEKICSNYTTQPECEANGCYWWSNNTCNSTPEKTQPSINITQVNVT